MPKPSRVLTPEVHAHIAPGLRHLATPIAELQHDPRNARLHGERNLQVVTESLRRYGQLQPVLAQKKGDALFVRVGNARMNCAAQLGWTHLAVMVLDLSESEWNRLAVLDNRSAELAEWDNSVLGGLLDELRGIEGGIESVGFDPAELDRIVQQADEAAKSVSVAGYNRAAPGDADELPETDEKAEAITQPGDLWVLGNHRLLCGDSTIAEDVERLMDGEKAGLCFTSPPYLNQRKYTDRATEHLADWDTLMQGVFGNLIMADDGQVLVNLGLVHKDGEWLPYWDQWIEWMRSEGWRRFGWYVWDQGFGLPGDWNGRFAPSHEFVFHFNRASIRPSKWVDKQPENVKSRNAGSSTMRRADGKTVPFTNPEASSQPTKIPDSVIRVGRQVGSGGHPAQFPVGFASAMLLSWGGSIYDPFLGSGTTLIASERLDRKCYGMEIEPRYCDVAVRRWQRLTGKRATRIDQSGAQQPGIEPDPQ